MRWLIGVLVGLAVTVCPGIDRESRGALVVFGDSLSDTGNVFRQFGADVNCSGTVFDPAGPIGGSRFPTPPFFEGRASNGALWIERLAFLLGEPAPVPSRAGGTNYACISAMTRDTPGFTSPLAAPDMDTQVTTYLASHTPGPSDVFVLWGGANDVLFFQEPEVSVAALIDQISWLQSAGATRFVVPNLPLLGQTPSGAAGYPAGLNLLSSEFNQLLDGELDDLRTKLDVTIYEPDVNAFFQQAITVPTAFGFTNTTDPALLSDLNSASYTVGFPIMPPSVAANPDEYLFWDGVHPTSAAHQLLGDVVYNTIIPEPSSLVLLSIGAFAMLAYRRRRESSAAS